MKETCKNCEYCSPTYKGVYCNRKKKKVKAADSCENWSEKKCLQVTGKGKSVPNTGNGTV